MPAPWSAGSTPRPPSCRWTCTEALKTTGPCTPSRSEFTPRQLRIVGAAGLHQDRAGTAEVDSAVRRAQPAPGARGMNTKQLHYWLAALVVMTLAALAWNHFGMASVLRL